MLNRFYEKVFFSSKRPRLSTFRLWLRSGSVLWSSPLLISLHKSIAEVMAYRKKILIIIIIKLCSVIKMLYSTVLLVQKAKQCSFDHLYFYLKHYTYIIQCRYVSLCTKICFSGPIQKVVLISRAGQLLQLSQQFNNVAKPKSWRVEVGCKIVY